ncbi:MAG: SDR family oxidoreductase [Acidobacteriota bacterium]|nr:SDR family oxidoreductase [Acidobacteriota bacterium]
MAKSRVALITGASAGLGTVFARKLAARGYELILVARRVDRLQAVAGELPVRPAIVAADLTTEKGLADAEAAIRDCPNLEMLVNNAGFGTMGRFWQTDMSGQEQMYRLHVAATMRLSRAALEGMVARGRGTIVNVSSVAAFAQSPGNVSYCATKAWMNSFTEGLALELRKAGSPVEVQALCPGYTVTEFHDTMGIDRRDIPSYLWMKAGDVVDASLNALGSGRVVVVPGWKYKATVAFLRHLPWSIRSRLTRPGRDVRV